MAEEIRGIDPERVSPWLSANVPGLEGEIRYELIAAGGSNLTYRVTDARGRAFALRRPPVRQRLATAHDMSREWKIIDALSRHPEAGVPVPDAVAYSDDESVMGSSFYVMSFAEGLILRDQDSASSMSRDDCLAATESLVDVQVSMHTLDLDGVGLGDLGRRGGYVERQLNRWRKQVEAGKWREVPLVDELYQRMVRAIPTEQGVGLAHGDYRFDNTVLGPDCRIVAVLDWELCTIGDPVADFFWSLTYWNDSDDEPSFLTSPPTVLESFPRRDEYAKLYSERSGFDLSDGDYFRAFCWWKMACIVEGALARMRAGAAGGGGGGNSLEETMARVDTMLELAHEAANAAGL